MQLNAAVTCATITAATLLLRSALFICELPGARTHAAAENEVLEERNKEQSHSEKAALQPSRGEKRRFFFLFVLPTSLAAVQKCVLFFFFGEWKRLNKKFDQAQVFRLNTSAESPVTFDVN